MKFRLIYGNILFVIFLSLAVSAKDVDFHRLNKWEHGRLLERCGKSLEDVNQAKNRIAFANKARQGQFPWAVKIAQDTSCQIGGGCTGSIISSYHILTAAHCFINKEKGARNINVRQTFYVLGGTPCIYTASMNSSELYIDCRSNNYKNPRRLSVSRIIIPVKSLVAQLRQSEPEAELAIVELSEPLYADDPDLRPICLPERGFEFPKKFVYYGFGDTEEKERFNEQLHWAEGNVDALKELLLKDNGMIEMFYKTPKENAPLNEDSGGGLIGSSRGRKYIIGVISGDDRCGCNILQRSTKSWYSNVDSKHDFICYYTGICPLGYNKYVDPNYPNNPEAVVYISDGNGDGHLGKDDAVVMKQFCSDRSEDCKDRRDECWDSSYKNFWCIGTCNPDCQDGSPNGLMLP